MYSNPPKHGALIVGAILIDHSLFKKWLGELQGIVSHVQVSSFPNVRAA